MPRSTNYHQVYQRRGYDRGGRSLCPHGYGLRANGDDDARQGAKYVGAQACRRAPLAQDGPVARPWAAPVLDPNRPFGFVVNVGKTLPDSSLRLAGEIPYGSETWKARYGRRNLSESRNSQTAQLGLKRGTLVPVFPARFPHPVQSQPLRSLPRFAARLLPPRQATSRQKRALTFVARLPSLLLALIILG